MGKTRKLFKKNWIYQENISCKDGHDSGKELTEAEEIKKRWQEYIKELYKKGLHGLDNYDAVVTHLELDILRSNGS